MIEKIIKSISTFAQSSLIIAQHMDRRALASFAARLDRLGSVPVRPLCTSSITVEKGTAYLLCDTAALESQKEYPILRLYPDSGFYHPTIDTLFASAADLDVHIKVEAYLLSGIGRDGVEGLKILKKRRPSTFVAAQDQATSKVYGMPRSAFEAGVCDTVLSIDAIAERIKKEHL